MITRQRWQSVHEPVIARRVLSSYAHASKLTVCVNQALPRSSWGYLRRIVIAGVARGLDDAGQRSEAGTLAYSVEIEPRVYFDNLPGRIRQACAEGVRTVNPTQYLALQKTMPETFEYTDATRSSLLAFLSIVSQSVVKDVAVNQPAPPDRLRWLDDLLRGGSRGDRPSITRSGWVSPEEAASSFEALRSLFTVSLEPGRLDSVDIESLREGDVEPELERVWRLENSTIAGRHGGLSLPILSGPTFDTLPYWSPGGGDCKALRFHAHWMFCRERGIPHEAENIIRASNQCREGRPYFVPGHTPHNERISFSGAVMTARRADPETTPEDAPAREPGRRKIRVID